MKRIADGQRSHANAEVIQAWVDGEEWFNGSGSLSTDGQTLRSYNLVIGETEPNGKKIAYKPASTSQTTRTHSNKAIAVADAVLEI